MHLSQKDLIGLYGMPAEEIMHILETAETMKAYLQQSAKKMPHMQGKSVVALFYENSTRTRLSFELAAKFLGATFSNLGVSSSSVAKGETLLDTGYTIEAMETDVIIIRHPHAGAPKLLGDNFSGSVINAGDGMHEHPTQALLDMFTMRERFGDLKGLNVSIIGDIWHSRVARSNLWGLKKLGANVTLCGPKTLMPFGIETMGARITTSLEEALRSADVVMGLRIQKERLEGAFLSTLREYHNIFGVNESTLDKWCGKDVMIMHPGPVNRGVEMSSAVVDADNSVVNEQVTNGVAVRMALLYLLTRRKNEDA
jgi:aspartate carbamoyltransferase catalytic subunit